MEETKKDEKKNRLSFTDGLRMAAVLLIGFFLGVIATYYNMIRL
jgi:hypothetical protein